MMGTRTRMCVLVAVFVACGIGIKSWLIVEKRLNLLLITLDTTRADHLGCYGYPEALTPTIDELAKRGVLFEHAYTTVPLTLPAHASIHTALYPFEHGVLTNNHHGLPDKIPTLAETLFSRGYATGAFIASFVLNRRFGMDRGFQTYDDEVDEPPTFEAPGENIRSADQIVDRAIAWLTAQNDKPFFCWLHLFDPHAKYLEHRETFGDKFQSRPYDAEIAFVDVQLKRLIDFLDARRLTERTMVVIVGDHGEGLKEHRERWHGYMLYNSTLRVPLIISLPSKIKRHQSVTEVVSLIDIAPTVLDCLDVPCFGPISGQSLKPALLGEILPSRACYGVAKEVLLEEGWSPLSCLITADWKYIQTSKPELYDLRNDPGETLNLAESEMARSREMRQQLTDLEASGVRYEQQRVELSERERRNLAGLGYLTGRRSTDEHGKERPDLKDMLDQFDAFQEVYELCTSGKPESAIVPLYQLINVAPRYLAPRLLLAQLLESQQKLEEAESQYLAILDIDPDNLETHTNLGDLLASQKQYEAALKHMLIALKGSPLSSNLHFSIGKVLRALKRPKEAATHFQYAENLANQQQKRWKPQKRQ